MIIHIAEVWSALAAAFVVGCLSGALLFALIARGPLAGAQWAVADAIGRVSDRLRDRFGMAPVWRAKRQPAKRIAVSVQPSGSEAMWEVVDRAVNVADASEAEESYQSLDHLDQADDADMASGPEPTESGPSETIPPPSARPATPPGHRSPSPLLAPPVPRQRSSDGDRPTLRIARLPVPLFTAPVEDEPPDETDQPGDAVESRRPAMLTEPRNGVPDNLQRIKGIGERNEVRLNNLGVFHFSQIAAWTPAETRWIGEQLSFPDRIERDNWVGQAIVLASGGETGFTKSAERRRARRRNDRDGPETDPDLDEGP